MSLIGLRNLNPLLRRNVLNYARYQIASISTSKKSKESLIYPEKLFPKQPPPPPKTVEDFAETKNLKSWISHGYDEDNYEEDRHQHKIISFMMYTILVCGGTFIFAYIPDLGERDWLMREAYMELDRRERLGLPLIDKNLIDPAKIELPTDEELGDADIII